MPQQHYSGKSSRLHKHASCSRGTATHSSSGSTCVCATSVGVALSMLRVACVQLWSADPPPHRLTQPDNCYCLSVCMRVPQPVFLSEGSQLLQQAKQEMEALSQAVTTAQVRERGWSVLASRGDGPPPALACLSNVIATHNCAVCLSTCICSLAAVSL